MGQFHARGRVFGVILVYAEHPAGTGADEGVVTGQQRVDGAAQQLVGGGRQHAVGLRLHVVEQAFLILGVEELTGLGGLLQAFLGGHRRVVG
ncbi:hypothetical protein D9M71_695910 [compost metagenome]